jgi:hypothetical protein
MQIFDFYEMARPRPATYMDLTPYVGDNFVSGVTLRRGPRFLLQTSTDIFLRCVFRFARHTTAEAAGKSFTWELQFYRLCFITTGLPFESGCGGPLAFFHVVLNRLFAVVYQGFILLVCPLYYWTPWTPSSMNVSLSESIRVRLIFHIRGACKC